LQFPRGEGRTKQQVRNALGPAALAMTLMIGVKA
jgi:hypothetical protein